MYLQEHLAARFNITTITSVGLIVQDKLARNRNTDVVVQSVHGGQVSINLPQSVVRSIAQASTFICLLGPRTLESEWISEEIRCAYELGKPMLPVFQEGYTAPQRVSNSVTVLLRSPGVTTFDRQQHLSEQSLHQIVRIIERNRRHQNRRPTWPRAFNVLLLVGLLLMGLAALGLLGSRLLPTLSAAPSPTPALMLSLPLRSTTSLALPSSPSATMDIEQMAQATVKAQIAARLAQAATQTQAAQENAQQQAEALALLRQTEQPEQVMTRVVELQASLATQVPNTPLLSFSPPPTVTSAPLLTLSPLAQAVQRARNFSGTTNADWQPFEALQDGVLMVLVPRGCFMMGSNQSEDDERPMHQQCFDEPFWLDSYEVTQAQFNQLRGLALQPSTFLGGNLPRETIAWTEALAFCTLRGGRLPTEAEWEYAARGPDGLIYPWGNEWNPDLAMAAGNSNRQTATIGSTSQASWVGARDMSGNVWEWTSSAYLEYPYQVERELVSALDSLRVVRGGSFFYGSEHLRATNRAAIEPSSGDLNIGFRCMRPV